MYPISPIRETLIDHLDQHVHQQVLRVVLEVQQSFIDRRDSALQHAMGAVFGGRRGDPTASELGWPCRATSQEPDGGTRTSPLPAQRPGQRTEPRRATAGLL